MQIEVIKKGTGGAILESDRLTDGSEVWCVKVTDPHTKYGGTIQIDCRTREEAEILFQSIRQYASDIYHI